MADFSILIQDWYRQNRRILPWRGISDPYRIWLSEIILQQTRVDQGMNYYLKFENAFPEVKDLANADEDTVLNLWQGLGYYSRARNLHFSAKQIMSEFKGEFPKTYKEVLSLKGVGEYTAAAITSIAYGLPHAVVDGNVYRVISRYFEIDTPIDTTKGKKEFTKLANELLDPNQPGDHNQAMMELGAMVCTPKAPACETECPVKDTCASRASGRQFDFPVKAKKIKVRDRYLNYIIYTDGISTVLKKRTGKGIWQGLYDFPMIETKEETEIGFANLLVKDGTIIMDGKFKHILSHQKLNATFWLVKTKEMPIQKGQLKVAINEVEDYPLPQLLIRYINASSLFGAD